MHKRICLIPLDSRPVCYNLPERLAASAGIELCLPSSKLLSHLKTVGNLKALQRWVKNHLFENDPVIVALDTIAYGGLIPSRIGDEPLEVLQDRIHDFFRVVKAPSLLSFSSIMRIPNYNNAQEEPNYWAQYGQRLYQYSAQVHEKGKADISITQAIPSEVIDDFLSRRNRNLAMNLSYIERLKQGKMDYLTFCQDDTGPWGLNVLEAQQLQAELKKQKVTEKSHVQTGADEVASCLLARWMSMTEDRSIKIYPFYSSEAGKKQVARFDGQPIETVVHQQVQACGGEVVFRPEDADLWLMVHTPESRQGDHCEKIPAKTEPKQIEKVLSLLDKAFQEGKPVALADVAYANGADPELIQPLLFHQKELSQLYGYAAWNTPGNTLGTAIAMGIVRLLAEAKKTFNPTAFNQLLLIRFSDDWLYQSHVRYSMRAQTNGKPPSEALLNIEMASGLALLQRRFHLEEATISCRFPCQRTFEVEIGVQA